MVTSESNLYENLQTLREEVKMLRERVDTLENRLVQEQEKRFILPVLFEPETGGYVVSSSLLPGLNTEGDTYEEAILHAKEAAELLLEVMIEDGDPLPSILKGYTPGQNLEITPVVLPSL
jgi:predicted RNase H-like HicB family nuclease